MGGLFSSSAMQTHASTDVPSKNRYVSATKISDQQKYKPADASSKNTCTSIGANPEKHFLNEAKKRSHNQTHAPADVAYKHSFCDATAKEKKFQTNLPVIDTSKNSSVIANFDSPLSNGARNNSYFETNIPWDATPDHPSIDSTYEIHSSNVVRKTANCNNTSSTTLNQDNLRAEVTNTWNTLSSTNLTDNSAEYSFKRCDDIGLNKACSLSDLRFDSHDHDHDTHEDRKADNILPLKNARNSYDRHMAELYTINMANSFGDNHTNISVEVTEECICETQNQSNLEQVDSVLKFEQQDRTEKNDHVSTGHYNRDSKLFSILTENSDAHDPQTQHVVEECISKSRSQKQPPYEDRKSSVETKHRGSFLHHSTDHASRLSVSFANTSETVRTPRESNKTLNSCPLTVYPNSRKSLELTEKCTDVLSNIKRTQSENTPTKYISKSQHAKDSNTSIVKPNRIPDQTSMLYDIPFHRKEGNTKRRHRSSVERTQSLRTSERERIQTPTDESSTETSGKINKTGSVIPPSQYDTWIYAKADLSKLYGKHDEIPSLTSEYQYTIPRHTEIQNSRPRSLRRTQSVLSLSNTFQRTKHVIASPFLTRENNFQSKESSDEKKIFKENRSGAHSDAPAKTHSHSVETKHRGSFLHRIKEQESGLSESFVNKSETVRTSREINIISNSSQPTVSLNSRKSLELTEKSTDALSKIKRTQSENIPTKYIPKTHHAKDSNTSVVKPNRIPDQTFVLHDTSFHLKKRNTKRPHRSSVERTQSLRTSERERIQTRTDESSMEGSGKTNKAWSEVPPSQYVSVSNAKADISKSDGKHGETPAWASKRQYTEPIYSEIQKSKPSSLTRTQSLLGLSNTFQRTKHVMACPLLVEENNFQRKESSDVKRTTIKQSRPGARSDSRAKTHSHSHKSHKDRLMGVLNVKRFSEVEVISMSFPQSLTIGDLRYNMQFHYKVTDNTEILLYQNFRQLQADRMVVKEIEVTDEPANILVCVSSKERRLLDDLVTDKPDMINPWDDDDRYLMSCGHAITPDNLHAYCWSELQRNKAELRCPAITNSSTEKCKVIWKFSDIVNGACLSVDEMNLFSSYLNKNWLDSTTRIQLCPSCGEAINKSSCNKDLMECLYCKRSGEKMWRFCFKCLQQWLNSYSGTKCGNRGCETNAERMRDILQTCSRKTIIGVAGCPCIRACPKCQYVLEHTSESNDSCKHMVCAACDTKFCFICLKVKTDTLYWPCGGAYEQCNVAPVQLL